jgi:hypothetical protein
LEAFTYFAAVKAVAFHKLHLEESKARAKKIYMEYQQDICRMPLSPACLGMDAALDTHRITHQYIEIQQ